MKEVEKIPYDRAKKLADRLVELLSPHCIKIDIAGSVRRKSFQVSDIEIVCLPKKMTIDLFSSIEIPIPEFWSVLSQFQKETGKDDLTGRYYKYLIPSGKKLLPEGKTLPTIQLDLFIPQADDYYRQLAIRTGSSNYSASVIAQGWRKIGWTGTEDGLRREEEVQRKGERWVCIHPNPTLPPVWESEEAFFQWLQVPYIQPIHRK